MTDSDSRHTVSPRELYSHLNSMQASLGAQIERVQSALDKKITELQTDMQSSEMLHDQLHQKERERRNALFRWAVTTIITGGAGLASIYLTVKGG